MDRKLPILKVWYESLWYVWALRMHLVLVLAIPTAVALGVDLLWYSGGLSNGYEMWWVISGVKVLLYSFSAVSCHRLILLGPGSIPKFGVDGRSSREWRFLCLVVAIAAITFSLASLVSTLYSFAGVPGNGAADQHEGIFTQLLTGLGIPIVGVIFVFLIQLSLVLPANAIDQKLQFGDAMNLAKGNRIRLLVSCHLPLVVASNLWSTTVVSSFGMIGSAINEVTKWVFLPFGVALLSVSYKRLRAIQNA